ncbi:MAG TPA: acyl-CoA dehydrogenase family protein, partial [Burkholderiales bacterium]|nr:acyl-CoA dehydrogenase family protein [Burkholderiales bacterium]
MALSAQHEMLRDAVRRYARERLWPQAAGWERDKRFPREALGELAAMGLNAVAIPERWGGAGMDYSALAIAFEEVS